MRIIKATLWGVLGADLCVAVITGVLMVDLEWSEEWVVFLLVIMCTLLR